EARLAGEAHAEEPRRNTADAALLHRHMGHGLVRDVDALDERLKGLARLRTLHGDHRPLFGGRGEPDLEIRPFGLEVVLHMGEDTWRPAGRRGDVKAVRRHAADDAVIVNEAVVAGHDAVAKAPRFKLQERVDIDAVEELGGVRADYLDLA